MIKLRIDVDYPFSNRAKSFFYVALRIRNIKNKDYLKNARIIARMINDSQKNIIAYWFFTPYTIPDQRLLELLKPDRHEVALHVVNNPSQERNILEKQTSRKVQYYTIHGTQRLLARILWGRKLNQKQTNIPADFPLKSYHDFETYSLDSICFQVETEQAKKTAFDWIQSGFIVSMHPEWLFQSSDNSKRGSFYETLKSTLDVDNELDSVDVRKRFGVRIARDLKEYEKSVYPSNILISKLSERAVDIFTFVERKWCCPIVDPPITWKRTKDNVGLLEIKDFENWWSAIGKKTRNMVRKAEKNGVKVSLSPVNDRLATGIWKIYNETPIRQERAFPHFGESLETVRNNICMAKKSTFISATIEDDIVGFIQILFGDKIAILSNILSLQKYYDRAINNALLAKAVEICACSGNKWLMYGRIGNHPSLDRFKENNGFFKYDLSRFYIPLTNKGKVAILFGLQQEAKDALPQSIKALAIPVFNWASRNKAKLKL